MTSSEEREYDLEERMSRFSERIVEFVKKVPRNEVTTSIVNQLIRSGTAIGSNYCEADDAESRKDFRHKIGIAKKEARETKYWLRVIAKADPNHAEEARELWREAKELHLICNAIIINLKNKS